MTSSPHPGTLCKRFHEETKYVEGAMDRFAPSTAGGPPPSAFKSYQTERSIDLVGYLPFARHPFTGGEMPQVPEATGVPGLEAISRLLYFTNGVTAIMTLPDGGHHYFRAAPSAGALYPTEVYLAVRDLPDLADGIYNYQVKHHSLVPVWEGDGFDRLTRAAFDPPVLAMAQVAVVLTGYFERGLWRYRERAYRRVLLDTGHVMGNLGCVAPTLGFAAFPLGGFHDAAVNDLLLLDDTREGTLAVVALPTLDRVTHLPPHALPPSTVSCGAGPEPEAPLYRQLHRAGYLSGPAPTPPIPTPPTASEGEIPYADADEIVPLEHGPIHWSQGIERTILGRRSARRFTATSIALEDLGAVLSFAYQPTHTPDGGPGEQMFDPTLLDTYILALRVDEVTPGLHFYDPLGHTLRLVRSGDFVDAARHVCLEQELGGDASALIIHSANLETVAARYGERGYRYLHLDAGHIGQRMALAALSRGLGTSGIGGFFDNDVTRLMGRPDDAIAYLTTLGPAISG